MKKDCYCKKITSLFPFRFYVILRYIYRVTTKKGGWDFFIKSKKRKYFVIKFQTPEVSLIATARTYLFMYSRVKKAGFIPLVYMGTKKECDGNEFSGNLWDVAFVQDNVCEIMKSDSTVICANASVGLLNAHMARIINKSFFDSSIHINSNWRKYFGSLYEYSNECWSIQPLVVEKVNAFIEKNEFEKKKILGVFLREEFSFDMKELHKEKGVSYIYDNHPCGPGVREIIETIKIKIKEWNCERIFVSTMVTESIEIFDKEFGEMCCYLPRKREQLSSISDHIREGFVEKKVSEDKEASRQKIEDYITELLILSKCDNYIGHTSNGTFAALILNAGKYENIMVLEDSNDCERYK